MALRHLGRPADRAGVGRRRRRALGLLRSLAQALRLWSWGGVACDLVVVNAEPASYQMALQREIAALRERHAADSAAQAGRGHAPASSCCAPTSSRADELGTLQGLARVRLHADGRPLLHHVQEWIALHEQAFERAPRHLDRRGAGRLGGRPRRCRRRKASFAPDSGEFRFDVSARLRPHAALDQRAGQPRLRRAGLGGRRRLHLGRATAA